MGQMTGHAHWFDHPNAVQAGPLLRAWLSDPGSMTFKLRARCEQLRVQRLRQHSGNALADECAMLALRARDPVEQRDVILHVRSYRDAAGFGRGLAVFPAAG
jgi:chorismate--pyruvate lyase